MPILANPISPDTLLSGSAAQVVLAVVLFAECGLLVGLFLPGDTLLFAAGVGVAIAGNLADYAIGYRAGPIVFDRPRSKLFRPEYVERAQRFHDRFGARTVLLARFVPVVRTVATVLAGVGRMPVLQYAAGR